MKGHVFKTSAGPLAFIVIWVLFAFIGEIAFKIDSFGWIMLYGFLVGIIGSAVQSSIADKVNKGGNDGR